MLDNLIKTKYTKFHLVPKPICGDINFVHNQSTLTHSALAGCYREVEVSRRLLVAEKSRCFDGSLLQTSRSDSFGAYCIDIEVPCWLLVAEKSK